MVPPVAGHPDDDRALRRHLTGGRQGDLQWPVGLERTVREQAVKPDGDAHTGDDVEHGRDGDAGPVQAPAPGKRHSDDHGQQRHQRESVDGDQGRDPALPVGDRFAPADFWGRRLAAQTPAHRAWQGLKVAVADVAVARVEVAGRVADCGGVTGDQPTRAAPGAAAEAEIQRYRGPRRLGMNTCPIDANAVG